MKERDRAYLVERGISITWSIAPPSGLARLSTAELNADVRDRRIRRPPLPPAGRPDRWRYRLPPSDLSAQAVISCDWVS
jgi:hypothetical protein